VGGISKLIGGNIIGVTAIKIEETAIKFCKTTIKIEITTIKSTKYQEKRHQVREFLHIPSIYNASRLLRKLNLPSSGSKKDKIYYLDEL
jgi:hypothetical protein